MTTPLDRVQADIKAAMKAREPERLSTLRMLLSALKNQQIASGESIDDDRFVAVVRTAIKQRKDAADQFRKGDRLELAEKEEAEIEILSPYLPTQASDDEIREAVRAHIEAEGLSGPKAMGMVMKAILAKFGATADGATVSRIAREVLMG